VGAGTKFWITVAADKRLDLSFNEFEAGNEFRRTKGDAAEPQDMFADFTGPVEVNLHVAATARYLDDGPDRARRVTASLPHPQLRPRLAAARHYGSELWDAMGALGMALHMPTFDHAATAARSGRRDSRG
jgi:hypothetical protein